LGVWPESSRNRNLKKLLHEKRIGPEIRCKADPWACGGRIRSSTVLPRSKPDDSFLPATNLPIAAGVLGGCLLTLVRKQPFDSGQHVLFVGLPDNLAGYVALLIKEQGRRNGIAQSHLLHRGGRRIHENRELDLESLNELGNVFSRSGIIQGCGQDDETALVVSLVGLGKNRHLFLAWDAPRRPEVQDNNLPAVVRKIVGFSICVLQGKLR